MLDATFLIFLPKSHGSIFWIKLIRKTQDCSPPIILTVSMKHSHMITILEFGLLILGTIFFISAIFSEILFTFIGQITSEELNYSWIQQDDSNSQYISQIYAVLREHFCRQHYFLRRVTLAFARSKSTGRLSMRNRKICSVSRTSAHRLESCVNNFPSVYCKRTTDSCIKRQNKNDPNQY